MEGSTRLNVVNKPLNDLMMHFSKFLAKERILHHVFYFSLLVVEVGCGGLGWGGYPKRILLIFTVFEVKGKLFIPRIYFLISRI